MINSAYHLLNRFRQIRNKIILVINNYYLKELKTIQI
jgi:hypothetical protein